MTRTAFVGATLIDGTGGAPAPDSAVLVQDGRIEWVGPASAFEQQHDLDVVDVAGKYLIPGLLDANVHLVLHTEPEVLLRYDAGGYDDLVLEAAQVALKAGFTTVFDTWGPLDSLRRVRDRINAGEAIGSRIFCAGNIIGNGGPWSPDFLPTIAEGLSSNVVEQVNRAWEQGVGAELTWMAAEDVRDCVREYIAAQGIDFVKFSSSSHAHSRFLAFSPDAQRAIVEEAHEAGMTAQACTQSPEALKVTIEAGVDLLQHGNVTGLRPMPDETVDLIAERQLPCVAFLNTERFIEGVHDRGTRWHGTLWADVLRTKAGNERRLIERGAKLMLAYDCGLFGPSAKTSPFFADWQTGIPDYPYYLGRSHINWLQTAFAHGMRPMDALLAATRNVAEGYRRLDDLGTVELGKRADLLVLDADPLAAPESYGRIAHVVKDGEVVDRDRLPEHPILTKDVDPEQWTPVAA